MKGFFSACLLLPIRFYQYFISPWLGPRCRFTPSCSAYALQAIRKHGALAGLWLAFYRIFRCHPYGGCGYDPVPESFVWPWRKNRKQVTGA